MLPLVATPLEPRVTGVPKFDPSMTNCTVPVGVALPALGDTVAVKVIDCPYVEALADAFTAVVVATVVLTVSVRLAELSPYVPVLSV